MRTRSQSRNLNRQQQQAPPPVVEPFNLEEPLENPPPPVVTMADNRTMAQLLEAPTEGYEDAIVVPEITADNFELKHGLLNLFKERAGTELKQEVTKKQKVDDVQETAEVDNDQESDKIKELMKIVSDEDEVSIDAIHLAVKPLSIVD
ncbi:hypothetical protein Tco_0468064 [Tanacetum coccineum]